MQEDIRFALDGMLSALAKYLRALGYDTLLRRASIEEFLTQALEEDRLVITIRKKLPEGYECKVIVPPVGSLQVQIRHLIRSIPLRPSRGSLFTRCLQCNVPTEEVALETVAARIPDRVKEKRKKFRSCPRCHKIYWWGSHADRMMSLLDESGAFDHEGKFDKGVTER